MFLALIGISAGMVVAGGVFSFIVELGVISDFADRTHTAKHILFYEDMVSAGAVLGNLFQIFEVHLPGRSIFLGIFGLFGGIFVGCWAMALAEILNVFPIFMRRARNVECDIDRGSGGNGRGGGQWLLYPEEGELYRCIQDLLRR